MSPKKKEQFDPHAPAHGVSETPSMDIGAVQPYQSELMPTLGCFRMYNADVFWLCHQAVLSRNNGIEVVIHVVS